MENMPSEQWNGGRNVKIAITQDFAANHAKIRWETTEIPAGNTKLTVRA